MATRDLGQSARRHLVVVHIPRHSESRGFVFNATSEKWVHKNEDGQNSTRSSSSNGPGKRKANGPHVDSLRKVLQEQEIQQVYWCKVRCDIQNGALQGAEEYHRVEFVVEMGAKLEGILLLLRKQQLGIAVGDISVVTTSLSYVPRAASPKGEKEVAESALANHFGNSSTDFDERTISGTGGLGSGNGSFRNIVNDKQGNGMILRNSLNNLRRSLNLPGGGLHLQRKSADGNGYGTHGSIRAKPREGGSKSYKRKSAIFREK